MQNRREFLKKVGLVGAVAAGGAVAANANENLKSGKSKKTEVLDGYAKGNDIIHQLIDLALLQNGMLKGQALDVFLKRSIDMIK